MTARLRRICFLPKAPRCFISNKKVSPPAIGSVCFSSSCARGLDIDPGSWGSCSLMIQVWQVPQTGPKHLHFKALLRGPQAQPSLRAEAKGPVNPETLLRYDLPPAGPCTAALDPALLSSDADTEAGWGLELAVWPRGPRSPPSLAPASGHRKPEAPSTASFLFSLGAKRQFRRCSGVLSRSKGFRGGGKFCLLQGLKSSRAGLATALRTPIKP